MINNDKATLNLSDDGLAAKDVQERIEAFVEQRAAQIAAETEANILERARNTRDEDILMARGNRQLTTDETKFYNALTELVRDGFSQGVSNVPLPYTIIERVFEDLTVNHPLLECVEMVTAPARAELVYNADGVKLATWGKIDDSITKELASGFKSIVLSAGKLSAFLPVSNGVLDLGPVWLDNYVRTVLSEAIAEGLEDGIINGNGKDKPTGMISDLSKSFSTSSGWPAKTANAVTALDPATYATILKQLATHPADSANGTARSRNVDEVIMIVNPATYLSKVYPAVTQMNANGVYVQSFPFPTRVIQSNAVAADKAIFGIDKKYFFGLCSDQGGKIEDSDHVKFLDDQRVYKVKLYGNGTPKDNNAFYYADISGLKPVHPTVNTVTSGGVGA